MEFILKYHDAIDEFLQQKLPKGEPSSLYQPISYLMSLGGKRIRPALVLLGCDIFKGNWKDALPAAYAMEVFHNFTLIHDDIMDNASLRRGKATVHELYDVNTAILSGDAMLIHSYEMLSSYPSSILPSLLKGFNTMALQLCEGQRMDMDFETRSEVSITDYLKMIEYKTSVLLACALQTGALIAGASEQDQAHLYAFGINAGIAFQIQDDLLDAFGEADKVGKQAGGDILQGKKTYLYLKALELADSAQLEKLKTYYDPKSVYPNDEKIETVKRIFIDTGAQEYAHQVRDAYNDLAKSHVKPLNIDEAFKNDLMLFADYMAARKM